MANYHLQFSVLYPYGDLTPKQIDDVIAAAIAPENQDADHCDVLSGITCEHQEDTEGIWFYSEDGGDTDGLIDVISTLQKANKAAKPFTLTWAWTCDKMRVDAFDGGAVCINPDGAQFWVNARTAAEADAAAARERGKKKGAKSRQAQKK